MKLALIDSKKLNIPDGQEALWFKGKKTQLYVIYEKERLVSFSMIVGELHIRGQCQGTVRSGTLDDPDQQRAIAALDGGEFRPPSSILIRDEHLMTKDERDQALKVIEATEGLPAFLQTQLLSALEV